MSLNNGSHSQLNKAAKNTDKSFFWTTTFSIQSINLIPTTFHKCLKHFDTGLNDDVVVVDVVAVNLMGVPTLARKMLTIWFELPPSFSTHPFSLTITPSHPLSP